MRAHVLFAAPLIALLACTGASSTSASTSRNGTSGSAHPTADRTAPRALAARYADWPAYHGDRGRSGYGRTVPPVKGKSFVYRAVGLDGAVYASPIVVGGRTIIATENNTIYSFTTGGTRVWSRHLGPPVPRSSLPCGNIDPLGITGTPVYSPATRLIYAVAELNNPIRHELYALTTTGAVKWHRSVDMPGVDPKAMQERGALTIEGGGVWVPFGGLAGDCGAYKGRLVRVLLDGTGPRTRWTVPTAREAGMWTPPGPAVDTKGYLYQSVGNGASVPGDRYDFSDSVLKLEARSHLVDYFSPKNWAQENAVDADLGSQGATIVGQWIFIAGKGGTAYILRQSRLGHIGGQVSSMNLCTSFGGTAVVGNTVYVPCTDGVRAVTVDSTGHMHVKWHASSSITGSPVVGGGRVWTLDTGSGILYGLSPSTGRPLNSVRVGSVTRFATPALYGHLVYVGRTNGYSVIESP
jgi:hypothetical protein